MVVPLHHPTLLVLYYKKRVPNHYLYMRPRLNIFPPHTLSGRTSRGELRMGKVSKFGIFSPAVIGAKVALGETRLNKIRGKVREGKSALA